MTLQSYSERSSACCLCYLPLELSLAEASLLLDWARYVLVLEVNIIMWNGPQAIRCLMLLSFVMCRLPSFKLQTTVTPP
jgi:hypothetical protein